MHNGPRKRAEDVRIPNIKNLPEDMVRQLHTSFAQIVKLRRSLETSDRQIEASHAAAIDSIERLKQLKAEGF